MKSIRVLKLGLVVSLGLLLWWAHPGLSAASDLPTPDVDRIVEVRSQQSLSAEAVLADLARAWVVYLGETHDSLSDHQAQFEIIQALYRLNPRLVIGMEMFQRPFQTVVDRYLAGKITEAELLHLTQYNRRWGYTWEFYAPVVRFAKQYQLPVIALNAPSEVARKVARTGLESLNLADRRFIPPRSAIRLEPATYRQRIRQIYDDIHQGKGNNTSFERFFQVQVLWDETMAERIAQVLREKPNALVVVLVGQGHLLYGEGIPGRVARRLSGQPGFRQRSLLLNPTPDLGTAQEAVSRNPAIADYLWYSQKVPSSPKPESESR